MRIFGGDRLLGMMERLGMVRDTAGDFDHPSVPVGHPARRHRVHHPCRRLNLHWCHRRFHRRCPRRSTHRYETPRRPICRRERCLAEPGEEVGRDLGQVVAAVDWTAPVGPGEEDRHQSPDDVGRWYGGPSQKPGGRLM